MRRKVYLLLPFLVLVLAHIACTPPGVPLSEELDPAATQTMQALATAVAGTLESAVSGEKPEDEEYQEEVAAPTATPTVTATPTHTLTPTPSAPMVSVSVDTNCRFGPGDVYDYLGALMVGEEAAVVGKLADESFWYIENPDTPPPYCWIWGFYAQVEGDKSGIPILTPPPTPTPSPVPFAFHAEYADLIPCGAYAYFVRIKNIGGVDIESVHLKVVDATINLTQTHVNDIFATSLACTPSTTPRLESGDTGYTFVSGFQTIANHTFEATVKVCTEDGLGGNCGVITFTTP
jgi:hypothetical protein